jgi:glucose/mannose-6-phosphate isomerase
MKNFIEGFGAQLAQALEIANAAVITPKQTDIRNIMVSGLGGSAFGAEITKNYIAAACSVPLTIGREYTIPAYVGKHTLFIACSYSGNTEETLSAFAMAEAQGAEIVCITSGGKLAEHAKAKGYNCITIPGGYPPRSAAGFAVVQQLRMLEAYGLIADFRADLADAQNIIATFGEDDHTAAKALAASLKGKFPVVYTSGEMESVAIRWRQQIEENSKQLISHHVIPEMNHNELVGWHFPTEIMPSMFAIFLGGVMHPRVAVRFELNKKTIEKHTPNTYILEPKGETHLGKIFYHLHFGDWVSLYLAYENDIDPNPVHVIDELKNALAKV